MIDPLTFAYLSPPPGQQGGGALMVVFLQIGALIAIFWFLLLRPQRQQQKKHEEMIKGIKKGDEVVTGGGIIGKIIHLADDRVTIQSGESRLVIERSKVTHVVVPKSEETPAK